MERECDPEQCFSQNRIFVVGISFLEPPLYKVRIEIDLGSAFHSTLQNFGKGGEVEVREVSVDDVQVNYEKPIGATSNLQVLVESLKAVQPPKSKPTVEVEAPLPKAPSGFGFKVSLRKVRVMNIQASLWLPLVLTWRHVDVMIRRRQPSQFHWWALRRVWSCHQLISTGRISARRICRHHITVEKLRCWWLTLVCFRAVLEGAVATWASPKHRLFCVVQLPQSNAINGTSTLVLRGSRNVV